MDDEWVLLPGPRLLFLHHEDFCDSRSRLFVGLSSSLSFTWLCRVARARSLSISSSSLCLVASQGQLVHHLIDPVITTLRFPDSRADGLPAGRAHPSFQTSGGTSLFFLHPVIRSLPSLCALSGLVCRKRRQRERERKSEGLSLEIETHLHLPCSTLLFIFFLFSTRALLFTWDLSPSHSLLFPLFPFSILLAYLPASKGFGNARGRRVLFVGSVFPYLPVRYPINRVRAGATQPERRDQQLSRLLD